MTRTVVRFIIAIEQKFDTEEPIMTAFGYIVSILGVAVLSGQFMRLVERLDRPARRRRSAA